MPKVKLYNSNGEESGALELSDKIFGVEPKQGLVHQVYTAVLANLRSPFAHTKDRSEVSGGGKKPWRQKGTGRARHGSIRSPLWRGGGVTFGPLKSRNYKQKINKKMNKLAVKMCLSDKLKEEKLFVFERFELNGKTKSFVKLAEKMPGFGRKILFITAGKDESLQRASSNVPDVVINDATEISIVDILHNQYIAVNKDAVELLEKRLS